jgi:hypothetical protein
MGMQHTVPDASAEASAQESPGQHSDADWQA